MEGFATVKIGSGVRISKGLGEEREAIQMGLRVEYQDRLPEGLAKK
jgi:hypothetical protein